MRAKPEGRKPTVNYHTGRTYVYICGTHDDFFNGLLAAARPISPSTHPDLLRDLLLSIFRQMNMKKSEQENSPSAPNVCREESSGRRRVDAASGRVIQAAGRRFYWVMETLSLRTGLPGCSTVPDDSSRSMGQGRTWLYRLHASGSVRCLDSQAVHCDRKRPCRTLRAGQLA